MNAFDPSDNPDAPLYVGSSLEWSFDKGTVDDRGEVISSCDNRFLIELTTRLDCGYEDIYHHFIEDEDSEDNADMLGVISPPEKFAIMSDEFCRVIHDTSILFVEIAREVRRLQRYQKLFPDEVSLVSFHTTIMSKLSSNHEIWTTTTGVMLSESCWKRLEKSEYLIEFWLKHPTYQYDLKPWQQFLQSKAPGSGINPKAKFLNNVSDRSHFKPPTTAVEGNFHILPPAGVAVWQDWLENFREVQQRIHRTVVPEHFRSNHADSTDPGEMNQLGPMQYRCETLPFRIPLNLWNLQVRGHGTIFPEDVLPNLEAIIGNLEGFVDIGFQDTTLSGMLVASEPSNEYYVFHHADN